MASIVDGQTGGVWSTMKDSRKSGRQFYFQKPIKKIIDN